MSHMRRLSALSDVPSKAFIPKSLDQTDQQMRENTNVLSSYSFVLEAIKVEKLFFLEGIMELSFL